MTSISGGSDCEWDDTLTKTSSNPSESDLECDKPSKKLKYSFFIDKLYELATCDEHSHIFGFSEDGMSLKILNPASLGPVLLRYFKHSNTSSFVRQLNNYGFKTISSASNGNSVQTFAHPYFHRDGKDMLDNINRKTAKNVKKCKCEIVKKSQQVEIEYRKRFRDMESRTQALECKNETLESENSKLKTIFVEVEKAHQMALISVLRIPTGCNPQDLILLFEAPSSCAALYETSILREKIVDKEILDSLMDYEPVWKLNRKI